MSRSARWLAVWVFLASALLMVARAVEPIVTTTAPSLVTSSTATMNASVSPGGEATLVWWRVSTVNPGSCDDDFGIRYPSAGGVSAGSGVTLVTSSLPISNLAPGVTHFVCALVSNASGLAMGAVLPFTTQAVPSVVTLDASGVSASGVTFNGTATTAANSATGWFRYSTTNPGVCDDTFGVRLPSSSGTFISAMSTNSPFSQTVSNVTAGSTIYYCALASSSTGVGVGVVRSVRVPGRRPTATASAATNITSTQVTLNGAANPNGEDTQVWFRYDTTMPASCSDGFGTRAPASGGFTLPAANVSSPFAQNVSGLTPLTTYYVCVLAENVIGQGVSAPIAVTTSGPPGLTTGGVTNRIRTSATVSGSVVTRGASVTAWFRYDTVAPASCDDTFGLRAPVSGGVFVAGGSGSSPFSLGLTGLAAGTTYYYCAIGESSEGRGYGTVQSFTTLPPPFAPTVTLVTASGTQVRVSVRASGIINESAGTQVIAGTAGRVRYATTPPAACDDTFGTAVSFTFDGSGGGSGTQVTIPGLTPNTLYYMCAVAPSAEIVLGTPVAIDSGFGIPVVSNVQVTSIGSTTATLSATVNPTGADATAYFIVGAGTSGCPSGKRFPTTGGTLVPAGAAATVTIPASTLTQNTNYRVCAYATNAAGSATAVGASFTTIRPPVVTFTSVSSITQTSATFSASVTTNGAPVVGWFRFDTTDPGTCSDTFGTRWPASGGTTVSAATGTFSEALTGLAPGTPYYACAFASGLGGLTESAVFPFQTIDRPTMLSVNAVQATAGTASYRLEALIGTGWLPGTVTWRYGTTDPGVCSSSYGTAVTATYTAGSTSTVSVTKVVSLQPGTSYWVCAIADNTEGSSLWAGPFAFTTAVTRPTIQLGASVPSSGVVRFSAVITANGGSTTGRIRWGTTAPSGCPTTWGTGVADQFVASGNDSGRIEVDTSSLTLGSRVYVCASASNSGGTTTAGANRVVIGAPVMGPVTVSSVSSGGAGLTAMVTPNWDLPVVQVRYSATPAATCAELSGTSGMVWEEPIFCGPFFDVCEPEDLPLEFVGAASGQSRTLIYACVEATNGAGTVYSPVIEIQLKGRPIAETLPTSGSGSSLQLNGTVNSGASTTYTWRLGNAPGTCSSTYGSALTGGSLPESFVDVSVSRPLSGLTPLTTYYYCLVAQNTYGTSYGSVLSFTTSGTAPAFGSPLLTPLRSTATVVARVNPVGSETGVWLRLHSTSVTTCDDVAGTRIPETGSVAVGAGTSLVEASFDLAGLAPLTTYWVCLVGANANGTAVSGPHAFTTSDLPTATYTGASSVTGTGAVVSASIVPNRSTTSAWFRYATTPPAACDDTFGAATTAQDVGAGTTAVTASRTLSGLSAATTYYVCVVAQNANGKSFSALSELRTAGPPSALTLAAATVLNDRATLRGSVNPSAAATTAWFRYGLTDPGTCSAAFGAATPSASVGSGAADVATSYLLTGLPSGTTYFVCAVASSSAGTTYGNVVSFTTTSGAPNVTTRPPTAVLSATATLEATVNPAGGDTLVWFRVSTGSVASCLDSGGQRVPATGGVSLTAGTVDTVVTLPVVGLVRGTTYTACAFAQNNTSTTAGAPVSFVTGDLPTISMDSVVNRTTSSATLRGSARPNRLETSVWFRYAATQPASCTEAWGTRAPASGGVVVPASAGLTTVEQAVGGLAAGTDYWVCAFGGNEAGTIGSSPVRFTTVGPPVFVTGEATAVSATSAQMNGTVRSDSSAFAWFRYGTTDPGTCSDSWGTVTIAQSVGAPSTEFDYSAPLTGLMPGVTYYFCALGSNVSGGGYGGVRSFTTSASAPTVTTGVASSVSTSGAFLNGAATPNGSVTTAWFRYAVGVRATCDDSFGVRVDAAGGDLGSGGAGVPFDAAVAVSPGVTYSYCAIASNSLGTSLGEIRTFRTPAPPLATTRVPTFVGTVEAVLLGDGTPNGADTSAWFRLGLSDPGACSDTFGVRVPAAAGTALGAGLAAVPFDEVVDGLAPGTTYYACAVVQSSAGLAFGAVVSFRTPEGNPLVQTSPPSIVASDAVDLRGIATPNGALATGWFRYGTVAAGLCSSSYGTRIPASGGTALGGGLTGVPWTEPLRGLTPGMTYHVCAGVTTSGGDWFGPLVSFTMPVAPEVVVEAPPSVSGTTAALSAQVNPGGAPTSGWFRIASTDPGSCSDSGGVRVPLAGGIDLGAGTTDTTLEATATGLAPGQTYYACAFASNVVGLRTGDVGAVVTASSPIVVTAPAQQVTGTSATLAAQVTPNRAATTAWFRWSTTDPGTCSDGFGTRVPASGGTLVGAGASPVSDTRGITGLTPGVRYYACAFAQNEVGLSAGSVVSFDAALKPTVTTSAATAVTGTSATLAGVANPNGSATTGWFRYGTTNPGTCSDAFGIRAPVAGGTDLGSGTSAQAFTLALSGLTPGTTYHVCAAAQNPAGVSFGAVQTFATPGAPVVVTLAATDVASSSATLRASVTPRNVATFVWFRWSTTDPGTCSDSVGAAVPAVPIQIGSGAGAVSVTEVLAGLPPSTVVYFCALAQNAEGLAVGSVLSFTTVGEAPSVTTLSATRASTTSATLRASVGSGSVPATVWFRYGTQDPGSCSDGFGTRAPASGGTAVPAGAPTEVTFEVGGLTPNVTYYACAVAQSSLGTTFGEVVPFRVGSLPTALTLQPGGVGIDVATLVGSAVPNGSPATGWFRFGTEPVDACADDYGVRAPATGGATLGDGSAEVTFVQTLTALEPITTYYVCAFVQNEIGTSVGEPIAFTTLGAPTVVTLPPTSVSSTGGRLVAVARPNGTPSTGWFRYATTAPAACDDTFGTRAPAFTSLDLGSGVSDRTYTFDVSALVPATTYYVCAVVGSSEGKTFGGVISFSTTSPPVVVASSPSAIASTSVTLTASIDTSGLPTSAQFRIGTSDPGVCSASFGSPVPAAGAVSIGGSGEVPFTQVATGLSPDTSYWYCATAVNEAGEAVGEVLSFTTTDAPGVDTLPAAGVESNRATLSATVDANRAATRVWFRWSSVAPGACDDTFGSRVPAGEGLDAGAASAPVTVSTLLTGLSSGVTVYACAIAENAAGKRFGDVVSFTTSDSPSVLTLSPTSVTPTSAVLQGEASPNGQTAGGWFRYSTTAPAACDDSFGTRAPVSGGTPLGAGMASLPFSQSITGLTAGRTYYVCALASNASGTGFGLPVAFKLPGPPSVTTFAGVGTSGTSANLSASVDPSGAETLVWFRVDTSNPGTCSDAVGVRVPLAGGVTLAAAEGATTASTVSTGLTAGRTYWVCALASNAAGVRAGVPVPFTMPDVPTVLTRAPTLLTPSGATLSASVTPGGIETGAWFRVWTADPGSCVDAGGVRAPAAGTTAIGSGSAAVLTAEDVAGLLPGATHYVCAFAGNLVGTASGGVVTFETRADVAVVVTRAADGVTPTSATLRGEGTPNGAATSAWFRYGTSEPAFCSDAFGARAPLVAVDLGRGAAPVSFSAPVTGLSPLSTVYYCAVAQSSEGTVFGEVLSFTPGAAAPEVTTLDAEDVDTTAATLVGEANPNGSETTGWFRYGTTEPALCDDTFGLRAPAAGGADLGDGTSPVAFEVDVTGLVPNETYWVCAVADSAGGSSAGEPVSFTTAAAAPDVHTQAPDVVEVSVTLRGSADPQGADTVGWFRVYDADPGTCSDGSGARVPAVGDVAIGAARGDVPFSEATELEPGTWWVCAVAENAGGVSLGEVLTFDVTAALDSDTDVETETDTDAETDADTDLGGSDDEGCACRVDGGASLTRAVGGVSLLGLVALLRRRRR